MEEHFIHKEMEMQIFLIANSSTVMQPGMELEALMFIIEGL
jgi:hypothetical protein